MAEITGVVIFDTRLFNQNGTVRRWINRVTVKFVFNAKQESPPGPGSKAVWQGRGSTGRMKESIRGEVVRPAPKVLVSYVSVNVPYALFVLRGTNGPIMRRKTRMWRKGAKVYKGPVRVITADKSRTGQAITLIRKGYMLKLPPFGGFPIWQLAVNGQPENNFLIRAFEQTGRTHPSIRGYDAPAGLSTLGER